MKKVCMILCVICLLAAPSAYGQQRETVYQMNNGKELTKAQVDSLSEVYNDNLTFSYGREGGKVIITVSLPGDSVSTDTNDGFQITRIDTVANGTGDGGSMAGGSISSGPTGGGAMTFGPVTDAKEDSGAVSEPEVTYMDENDNEISRKAFISLLEDQGGNAHYTIHQGEGQRRVVMRPPNSEVALEHSRQQAEKSDALTDKVGELFPFESLTSLDGTVYDREALRDKIVVMNYWYVECAPCIREMPSLNALQKSYAGRDDVVFLAPSLSDAGKIRTMLQETPFEYTLIPDAVSFAEKIGIYAYPTNMIIDREGRISFVEVGYHEDTVEKIRTRLEELAGGE